MLSLTTNASLSTFSNRPELFVGDRRIAAGEPVMVIAEIGVNHDGDVGKAMRLVEAAADAGADAVKLQVFTARRLLHPSASLATYQQNAAESASEMLRSLELSDHEIAKVVAKIRELDMIPLATPFSPEDVGQLVALDLPAIKLASPDLTNALLLDAVLDTQRPLILSTGTSGMDEVRWASRRIKMAGAPHAFLQCVSSYPTQPEDASLAGMAELAQLGTIVGYSDHTQVMNTGAYATASGACIIEKHLTLDRAAPGPDHAASADPQQLREYIRRIRLVEQMVGQIGKNPVDSEAEVRRLSKQSLVAAIDIPEGVTIERSMLTCQRPGTAIPAMDLDQVIGRVARRNITAGSMLYWFDLSETAGDATFAKAA